MEDCINYYNKLLNIKKIKDKLMDEESKIIFDAKIDYMITRDDNTFIETVWPFLRNMYSPDLVSHTSLNKNIIIFGCGYDGIKTKNILEMCGYNVEFFCDSNKDKVGKIVEGIRVLSKQELMSDYQNYLVVLASRAYVEEMYEQLVQMKFPIDNIIYPRFHVPTGFGKKQYFDVFCSRDKEVFVDAGAYNGDTTKEFMIWSNMGGKYKKIFVLEPIEEQFEYIKNRKELEKWNNVVLCKKAAWNCHTELNFLHNKSGSSVVEKNTGNLVIGEKIDEIVGNEQVTFIKMDVEGSELKALEGAKETIRRNKPKLAISVYHKYEDIIDIPLEILSIMPEYNFYLRHYSTESWETVLYAVI